MHNKSMEAKVLKRTCVYKDARDLKTLEHLGKKKGGLKLAQMIRVAIADYLTREQQVDVEKSKR